MPQPRIPILLACVAAAVVAAACGGGSGSNGGSSSGSGDTVVGAMRLGWDQQATDASQVATLHFVIYIDGLRTELPGASCSNVAAGSGFPCSAVLPVMSTGQHTIELAAYIVAGGILEGPKSAPLVITVSGANGVSAGSITFEPQPAATAPVPAPAVTREVATSDGTRLAIVPVARTEQPSALAVANDGTLFVGDSSGVVRVFHAGIVVGETALAAADAAHGEGRGILDLALDPQFERTHVVYVLDTTGGAAPAFRLSRYREVGGRLGERAVLVDGVAASPLRPSGALAFGPDARLYLALDDGGDPESAGRAASYNGKVLRLSVAGTTAADQAGGTPVYASNLHAPRSLSWDPATAAFWMADAATQRAARVRGRERAAVTTAYRLPLAEGPGSVAVYRGSLIASLQGDLLVAPLEAAAYLLRARVSDNGQNTLASAERLAIAGFGSLRLVEVGADGAIYVGTDEGVLRMAPR